MINDLEHSVHDNVVHWIQLKWTQNEVEWAELETIGQDEDSEAGVICTGMLLLVPSPVLALVLIYLPNRLQARLDASDAIVFVIGVVFLVVHQEEYYQPHS